MGKNRFSEEQIIGILKGHQAGVDSDGRDLNFSETSHFRSKAGAVITFQNGSVATVYADTDGDRATCPTSAPVGQIEGRHERRMLVRRSL